MSSYRKRAKIRQKCLFSHKRNNRWFKPNIITKKYWLESENRWVKLKVSTRGNKIIDKRGIETVVKEIRQRGEKV